MPISDAAYSTLAQIRTKVRRLTRSPSTSQLPDATLDGYINNFVLYDFPEQLRLFSLRKTLTFYTQPYIDTYTTNTTDPNDPLYNFINLYTTIHQPVYIAGYDVFFSQSREQFFSVYPKLNSIASIGFVGDGIITHFAGTLPILVGSGVQLPPSPAQGILQNNVLFSSVDIGNFGLALIDQPVTSTLGNLVAPDNPTPGTSFINYLTGQYDITFPTPPAVGAAINSQVVPYVASRPLGLLYFDNAFILRPVPDQPYRVDMEVYMRPSELLSTNPNQMPELSEWWQYISYGAAKKVFEDRMDMESIQNIMPEFKQQERLILRRTLMQLSNERTATIYTEQVISNYGQNQGGWGLW
jgi:hypothetical protein